MKKTTWLLDLDGVVNANAPRWGAAPRQCQVYTLPQFGEGAQWRIRWAPLLLARILAIHARPDVEVQWCSTWCQPDRNGVPEIRRVERALRMPELACAFVAVSGSSQTAFHSAKRAAALAVLDLGNRLIWTDDEVVPDEEDPFGQGLLSRGEALLIRPRPNRGLTREDMTRIEDWTTPV